MTESFKSNVRDEQLRQHLIVQSKQNEIFREVRIRAQEYEMRCTNSKVDE